MHIENDLSTDQFIKAVIAFSSHEAILKSYTEMLYAGLSVYQNLKGCISASFFLYDKNEYEFEFKASTDEKEKKSHLAMFKQITDAGGLPKALSQLEIVEWELTNKDNETLFFLIIPLLGNEGVLGILLICMSNPLNNKEILLPVLKLHSDNFALRLNNTSLSADLAKLKEITEEKIAIRTKDIVQSTRELRQILDSVKAGLIMFEQSTRIITNLNSTACKLIGATAEQIVGSLRDEIYLSFTPQAPGEIIYSLNEEIFLRKANGTLLPVVRTTESVSLGDDVYYLDSFIDISDRKAMESALQKAHFELEQRVEERTLELSVTNAELKKEIQSRIKAEEDVIKLYWAVHQNPASIIITDLDGVVEYINPSFTVMTGFPFAEIVGEKMNILKSGDLSGSDYKVMWDTIKSGKEWRGEYRNRKKNGDLFWISSTISPIRNLEGEISNFLSIQEDITEKKLAYEELITAKERAESADKLKSSLLANMNHEFRTPLIGILGFSQLLMQEELENDLMFMIQGIHSSGKRLLNTLNGVLALSEQAVETTRTVLEKIDINQHLPFAIRDLKAQAELKGLSFELIINTDPNYVFASAEKLISAIEYIVDNAVKYTPEGYIKIISDSETLNGKKFGVISVMDSGIGIDDKDMDVIFEAFRQASEGYSRNYEGCGLGLTLAQKAINELNGTIEVESKLTQGSVFTIKIPHA